MGLPPYVHIGPFTFVVKTGEEVVDFFKGSETDGGDCDAEQLTLRVKTHDTAEGWQRDTTWHEVFHAAAFASGATEDLSDKAEEKIVRRLATATLAVLRDNPDLVAYLTE